MRRFFSIYLVVVGCCIVLATVSARSFGNDQLRTSAFRVLTSEQSEGPTMTAPVAEDSVATPPSAVVQQAAAPPQSASTLRISSESPAYVQAPVASQAHRPVGIYVGNAARQTLNQFPRRPEIQTNAPRPMRRQSKPFENAEHEPTLSPYLNLDRDENDTQNVPNYFTLVRPQMEQLQTNRTQQREIQQLRGQLQSMTSVAGPPQFEASRAAGMGSPARYMDTAQFYGGSR